MITEIAAWISIILIFGMMCFQILLAMGFPYGHLAWGGKHIKLPINLRIASLISAGIFVVASLFILEKSEILLVFNNPTLVTIAVWVLFAFFVLNTLSNLASKSKLEKRTMTPISLALAILSLIIAITAD